LYSNPLRKMLPALTLAKEPLVTDAVFPRI
jgi:hypothetical protein